MQKDTLDKIWGYSVFSLENLLRLVVLSSLAFYLSFYHYIKILLESSMLVSVPLLLLKWRSLPSMAKDSLPVLLLLLVYPLGFLLAYDQHGTPLDWRYYNQAWRAVVPVFLLFIALETHKKTVLNRQWTITALATGLLIAFALAVAEWFSQSDIRVTLGTNLILVFAATVSVAAIFLLASVTLKPTPRWLLMVAIPVVFAAFATIILSNSRGPLLALLVGVAVLFLFFPVNRNYRTVALAGLIAVMLVTFLHKPSQQRIAEGLHQTQAYFTAEKIRPDPVSLRLEMIRASLHEIMLNPLKIRGTQPLKNLFSEEVNDQLRLPAAGRFDHTHNDFIQAWLARGPLGFIGLLIILSTPLLLTRKNKAARIISLILMFNAVILGMTNTNFTSAFFLKFYIFVAFVLAMSITPSRDPETEPTQ